MHFTARCSPRARLHVQMISTGGGSGVGVRKVEEKPSALGRKFDEDVGNVSSERFKAVIRDPEVGFQGSLTEEGGELGGGTGLPKGR